ncbi:MAG: methyltransferase [Lachnospiraceae bacterium]|nr:methyltransferase [Lachnospiraceae bacterium]
MTIRNSTEADLGRIMEIYAHARAFMAEHGNPDQWGPSTWPPEKLIRRDIEEGHSYVCVNGAGRVIGVFYYREGNEIEPAYREIRDGVWRDERPYGVVHRIASDHSEKGIGAFCINWAYEQCGHLRIDTHGDNVVMQRLLKKLGFIHCGTIFVEQDDAPRLAYEKSDRFEGNAVEQFFERDGNTKPEALAGHPWLRYLLSADRPYWNAERIGRMSDRKENAPLKYTLRTLDLLMEYPDLDDDLYETVRTALCWSEAAKGGSAEDRARWRLRGYPLEIHNEASALIYADHCHVRDRKRDPVFLLIKTHGLAGQYLRGECAMADSAELHALAEHFSKERFCRMIYVLNACIIRAVGEEIWNRTESGIRAFAENVYEGIFAELDAELRIRRLLPESAAAASLEERDEAETFFGKQIFPRYDLWYFESALAPFRLRDAVCLTALAKAEAERHSVRHLNFKPLADVMYYDFEGRKHVNTYRQRIIEHWLREPSEYEAHVTADYEVRGETLQVGVRFTPACEKLIAFCVEAERSGILSYEKSITMLFDAFGFRRDAFDRLNNEEKYLSTMNDADESTKLSILDYVTGKRVLDVGSGGGVLLDALEERFPSMEIIGTDISQNVIEVLNAKRAASGRHWTPVVHNFVEDSFPGGADSVIFSSILHEIYSYTDRGRGLFDIESVETALKNAAASLNPGGRIIIRDGVKTPGGGKLRIRFKAPEGMEFFRQFVRDFRGMDDLPEDRRVYAVRPEKNEVLTDINFGREFLYTYTWGRDSFAHECRECFGYYTVEEYRRALEAAGLRVIAARSVLEPGYPEHLSPLVELSDESGAEVPFPDSKVSIVAEL